MLVHIVGEGEGEEEADDEDDEYQIAIGDQVAPSRDEGVAKDEDDKGDQIAIGD
jgi:hypothetical protein